eukprot:g44573.t1
MGTLNKDKVVVVVGVGKGIGGHVATHFASKGFRVALLARNQTYQSNPDKITPLLDQFASHGWVGKGFVCDAGDAGQVKKTFSEIRKSMGDPCVLIYNAGARDFTPTDICDLSAEKVERYWRSNCLGALFCMQQVIPHMQATGQGCVILTGATASIRGSRGMSSFAIGKFGLRALAQSAYQELSPQGICVTHVIIDSAVDLPLLRKIAPPG